MADNDRHNLDTEGFSLGNPALICRWRLARGTVLLENRHLRALARRFVNERPISPELVAWVKQHIEWTLAEGCSENPNGVLMLIIDENGQAAMTVGPYEPLRYSDSRALFTRARSALREQDETEVAPEVLFAHVDDCLMVGVAPSAPQGGCASLVIHLARTLGIPVIFNPRLIDQISERALEVDGIFLASDEHGVISANDYRDSICEKFQASYLRLAETAKKKRRR